MRSVLLALAAFSIAFASCECAPPVDPPAAFIVSSSATSVAVALAPFALTLNNAARTSNVASDVDPSCAPLALGLRADDDLRDWHHPQAPRGDELWLHSGDATVVSEDPLTLDVALADDAGRAKTARVVVRASGDGWVDVDVTFNENELNIALVSTCFALATNEHLVGGGERFEGPDLRGKIVPLQFEAPGQLASGTNEAHAPVPFYASSIGYALLLEGERVGAFDVGVSANNATVVRAQGASLPLRLRAGSIVENTAAHARKMGLPPAPPRWALAPMQWRNDLEVTLDADGNVVTTGVDVLLADVDEMRARGIPTSTLWIDAPWETGYNTFVFNEQQLPDIDAVLADVRARGFRVLTWATEHVNNSDDSGQAFGMPEFATRPMFQEYEAAGLLVSTSSGDPFEFPWGRGSGGYVDFTNPVACDAWRAEIRPMLERGVNGFKLDYGETMRADVLGQLANDIPVFSDGSTTSVQHTRYARLYHECYLQALDEVHGSERFVITRSGGIFDQKNGTAIWPGDLDSEFERTGEPDANGEAAVGGVPAAVHGFLSLQMSAYPLYGADVGGYRGGTPSTEAWLRWAQAGALSTVMQVGGGGNQAAWDAGLVDVIDAFSVAARLHMDLVPMWEHWLARSAAGGGDGTPIAVPVGVLAPDALNAEDAWADSASYVLGDDALLAAPVIEAGARTRDVFVPPGRWRSWWDGSAVDGPGTATVDAPLERVPLFQNENAILVLSHPRIVTLLDNGAEPGGDDDMGAARVVRVMSGTTAAQATVGDIIAARTVDGTTLRVDVLADAPRPLIIDLFVDRAFTLAPSIETDDVDDEDGLLACTTTCVLVEPGRVRLAGSGRDLALQVTLQ